MAEPEYVRLTRWHSRSSFGIISVSRSSLWLGKDHLLSIETTGYKESYKRFYFSDVQAILLRKTADWIVWSVVFGTAAGGFGLMAFAASEAVFRGISVGVGGLCLLAFLLNLAAGPSCKCYLRTAVQVEELPSLNRFGRAGQALTRLRPLLIAAQGQVAPEEISRRTQETMASSATDPVAVPVASPGPGSNVSDPPR
jgi:hypothetical protein